ncbi:hypothetical protein [Lentzea kentuckyensis]|uniref:NACHT N-terminal Helical domain 1-containing protein n=1 Tax=Lentzea kentuckyensis TaxID=360086 RepID=UPI000A38C7AF|nr:hypothetical protein [Lentzea kentuckyensis]
MVALESIALNLAKTIAQKAVAARMADRRNAEERKKELTALLTPGFWHTKPLQRFIEEATSELASFSEHEFRGLDDGDRAAALFAVGEALEHADTTDRALFAVDLDPEKLARRLRAERPQAKSTAALGDAGGAFYDAALDRCCALYLRAVTQIPAFLNRSQAEMLNRLSALPDQVAASVIEASRRHETAAAGSRPDPITPVADRVRRLVDERASLLVGRAAACAELDAYVAIDATGPLVLRAPAGFGKTTLLASWIRRRHTTETTIASHFFATDRDLTSVDDAYRHLLRQISAGVPTVAADLALGGELLHDAVYKVLKAWPSRSAGRLVVVVDALDEARQVPAAPMFPLPLPERVSVILSTRAGTESDWLVPSLDAWTQLGTALELEPLDRDGLRAWLSLVGDGRLAELATDAVAGRLAAVTAGFPLFVRFLLDDLVSVAANGGDPADVSRAMTRYAGNAEPPADHAVPSGFARYVRDQFVRLARTGVPPAVQSMFALVAVSPGPLPEPLIQARTELSAFDLANLPWSVMRWFSMRIIAGENVYSAAHPLLAREFRLILGAQAAEAQNFLLRVCVNWREDTTGWALRWFADLLVTAGRGAELLDLARDDAFQQAQLAAYPDEPDLALAASKAAIRHAAAERNVVAVAEAVLRHARDVEALKYDRTPLEALRAGSLAEATRRAALFDPERVPLWTLLLAWELADTGHRQQSRDLFASLRIADLPTNLGGWLARTAMICAVPVATLSPDTFPTTCHRLVVNEVDVSIESDALAGLTWLATHLVDTGRPREAVAVVQPFLPTQDAIRRRIATRVAENDGSERALEWVRRRQRPRGLTQTYAAIAAGRARAGDNADATRMFQLARDAAHHAGEREDWALSDIAGEQARAGRFAEASTTIAEIRDAFACSRALESLATEQTLAGDAPDTTLDELRQLAVDQPDITIGLRLGSAYLRAGRTDDATAMFQRLLAAAKDDHERARVSRAQFTAGDVEGGYATLLTIGVNWWPGLVAGLTRARAEQAGLPAALVLVDELRTRGLESKGAIVSLAEWAVEAGDTRTARTLLAQILGAPPSAAPWAGPADAQALSFIATTLAGCGRIDDVRAVLDMIADQRCRNDILPALAAALVKGGRRNEALDLLTGADAWTDGQILAAVAVGHETNRHHTEAMGTAGRIDRVGIANDALVQMGCTAAGQHRYDDARSCQGRIRSVSMSTDPERDSITSAIAVAQCADGDFDGALATAGLLRLERSVSMCLTELARTCQEPSALDRIRRAAPLAPAFRLAPLVAVAAAYRGANRPHDAHLTLQAALEQFQTLCRQGDNESVPWVYDRDYVATTAAELALETDYADLHEDAQRVRDALQATEILRQKGLREIFLRYALDGQHDRAQWALKAMDNDFDRCGALGLVMSGPQPPPYGNLLTGTVLRLQNRSWLPVAGHALALADDWSHLALLLLPAADSVATAHGMLQNFAVCATTSGLPLARLITESASR